MSDRSAVCHYCKQDVPKGFVTKDHVVPRARGGADERWNIVDSCGPCNVKKADSWPTCSCNFCRRSRRRHWEKYAIAIDSYVPKN